MEDSFYNDLLIELECPICTNYMSPPIRQCATGHSICESCRKKLPKCALCQGKFTESRNISLEGLAVKMRYPCINIQSGCTLRLAYNEREAHELECSYKGLKCPMEKCPWVGRLEDIGKHWASKKMISKPYHASNVCHTKMKSESYYVNIVEAYNKLFWFKCKLMNRKLYWAVQFIGNSSDAENYFYEIEVFKSGRTKRKILISDYCQSIDLENACLFKEGVCICIHSDMVDQFLSDDQLLIYYMRVHAIKEKQTQEEAVGREIPVARKQRDRSQGPQNQYRNKDNKFRKQSQGKNKGRTTTDGFVVV